MVRKTKENKGGPVDNSNDNNIPHMEKWSEKLTHGQYHVCIRKETQQPFTGKYLDCKKDGLYCCVCSGNGLFDSEAKFDSGTGLPSFWAPADTQNLKFTLDKSHGMRRIEVQYNNCGAHLAHVFDDALPPTGKRYCINSASLKLRDRIRVG